MTFLIIVGVFLFYLSFTRLSNRVDKLEKELRSLRQGAEVAVEYPTPLSAIPSPVSEMANEPLTPRRIPYPYTAPETTFTPVKVAAQSVEQKPTEWFFYTWFKEQTLIKIGGIFFFLGAVWFVSYAISLGWISPEIRIAFGFGLALLIYILGYYRAKNNDAQYLILTALGTGIMCATVSAAQIIFTLFPPLLALTVLALSIAYTAYVALQTKTAWLATLAGLAGLLVPLIIGEFNNSLWLLLYLLLLTVGLLTVSVVLNNRFVPLLMALGVTLFELRFLAITESNLLWFFVVVFSAVFLAGVTITLARFGRSQILDILTLLLVGVGFVYFASAIALSATLATFIATFVLATIGYIMAERKAAVSVVSLYAGFAVAGLLVATSFLFSGFSLTLAYIAEITAAFFIVTYLGLPERVVWIATGAYLLPFFASLPSFTSSAWQVSITHPDALVLYFMAASFIVSTLWLMHKPTVAIYSWSRTIATLFGVLGFFYLYGVVAVVMDAIFTNTQAMVMTYLLWGTISLLVVYYAMCRALPVSVIIYSALTLLIPLLASMPSFVSQNWAQGVNHPDGLGVLGMLLMTALTTLLLTQQFNKEYDGTLIQVIAGFVVSFVVYLFIFIYVLWHGLINDYALAVVAVYTSYGVVLYGLTSLFVMLRTNVNWIMGTLATFTLPVLMSISSFSFSGWEDGVLAPEAVGLFALTMLFILLALGLRDRYAGKRKEDIVLISNSSRFLFATAFVYSVCLTWSLAHTVVAAEQAISTALFIYTVSGLLAYQYGKTSQNKDWRYVGVALLSLVVGRLLLVDVWEMELLYKIITFLGIGSLFIGAALFEKTAREEKTADNNS